MKKIILSLLILSSMFVLTACGMTNDEIINETKKCKDAGLDYREVINGLLYHTTKVVCQQPDNK